MRKILLLLAFSAGLLSAQAMMPAPGRNLWRVSLTTLGIANALDVHSSWGKHELNSALASSNGTFGGRGALMKSAFQGGFLGIECLLARGHRGARLYRALAIINFAASAAVTSVAIHNYTVPRPGPYQQIRGN